MSVTTKPQNPAEQLRTQLRTMTPEFANALPSHIKPERFQRVVMTVAQQNPDLLKTDRRSLLAACIKCASDGLIPDGREAALVIYGNKAQYLPMVGGYLKRIRNSGEVAGLVANVVYQNDGFVQRPDDFEHPIEHRPPPLGTDRGKPLGAYALAKLKDGTIMHEVMDVASIDRVRAVSRASKNGPWVEWWDRMAEKTLIKRLAKLLPMDSDVETMIRNDDRVETGAGAEASNTIDGIAEMPLGQIEDAGKLGALEAGIDEDGVIEGAVEKPADAA
jgi:recombination protein RecT